MNLLQKVPSFIRVEFISSDKSVESAGVIRHRLLVEVLPLFPHTYR